MTKTEEFEKWLAEAVTIKAKRAIKDAHDVYQYVEMFDAKISFMSGVSPDEYSKDIKTN